MFHKFQQAGSSLLTRDTTRGTGLGLYISKMIAEEMGGVMALKHSEVDKGSVFSFTLPVATAEQQKSAASSAATATPQVMTDTATGLTKEVGAADATPMPAATPSSDTNATTAAAPAPKPKRTFKKNF